MINIKTYIRKSATSNDGVVWVLFYTNREKVHFSTKVRCLEKDFNENTGRVKSSDKNAADKNLIIEQIWARINAVFVKFRLRDKKMTRDGFMRTYNRPDDFENFHGFCRNYYKKFSKMNEPETMQSHDTVLKKLQEYSPHLHFDDITTDWLDDYYAYLRKKLKNCENTAYKNMSTLRKYVRAAWKAGYMDEYPFDNWSIKRTRANYTYLTEDELAKFIEIYKGGGLDAKRHKALELFLFMCFSSLHIGDAFDEQKFRETNPRVLENAAKKANNTHYQITFCIQTGADYSLNR
ncbi:hypothetical protein AGMMS4957_19320 [Bacteroidia bacterium]|nr:hypothetical protein AGMMS4957_19320 [Bacteroidia bacterium]